MTFKDRLAHANYRDVKRWLGEDTDLWLRDGGKLEIDIAGQVSLEPDRLVATCSRCPPSCTSPS